MRLWSIHPRYLDAAGLTACWRESLLARKVLRGETRGYRFHPQLCRFRKQADPLSAVEYYLSAVLDEADRRGYRFDSQKVDRRINSDRMSVTDGQLQYEFDRLKEKLYHRNRIRYDLLLQIKEAEPHPAFDVVSGGVEEWEIVR